MTDDDHKGEKAAPVDGSVEQKLAPYIEAATADRPRLHPHAVARIEERLNTLAAHDDPAQGRFWRGLRVPAYIGATALVAVVLWSWLPRGAGTPIATAVAPAPLVPRELSLVPMRLDEGTLQLRTEALPRVATIVETPAARVEVAPQSVVSITVTGSAVRILATGGSARILYYDGRNELVAPSIVATGPAVGNVPNPSPASMRAPQHHPRAQGATPIDASHAAAEITPPVVAPIPMDGERASFTVALARVRSAPAEALTLLDAYLARYPEGAYTNEAARVRIAVLIRLQRKPEALAALDRVASPSTELRVMRAELRADAQRYEEAIADFGAVLFADEDHFAQRALYGRALARQKLGDRVRMTEDLSRYLLLFPRGEYAERVRIELRRATSEASR